MSLFSKTEVNPKLIPFINKGEGVGIVNINGYGKASARIESYKIILESYKEKNPIIESISSINYLSYDEGNFFNEPKLEIGISNRKYVLAGVENNDEELYAFYQTILNLKNLEKEKKNSSKYGQIQSIKENADEPEEKDELDVVEEEIALQNGEVTNKIQLEDESLIVEDDTLIRGDSLTNDDEPEEIVDEIPDEKNLSFTQSIRREFSGSMKVVDSILDEDDDFDVLEEELIEEDREIPNKTKKEHKSRFGFLRRDKKQKEEENTLDILEEELNEDIDKSDIDDEELDLAEEVLDDETSDNENELDSEDIEESSVEEDEMENLISENVDEDAEDIEDQDEEDASVEEVEESQDTDEVSEEESEEDELEEDESEDEDNADEDESVEEDSESDADVEEKSQSDEFPEEDVIEFEEIKVKSKSKPVKNIDAKKEPIIEDSLDFGQVVEEDGNEGGYMNGPVEEAEPISLDVPSQTLSTEMDKMKQQLTQEISSMQNNFTPQYQANPVYSPTVKQVDPVDQIRRYHELKEEGIITEEEFERKKKELLEL